MKGTLNVLSSCSKVPSIKRVVLTSSVAALLYNGLPLTPEVVVDESWFSDQGFCKETKVGVILPFYQFFQLFKATEPYEQGPFFLEVATLTHLLMNGSI